MMQLQLSSALVRSLRLALISAGISAGMICLLPTAAETAAIAARSDVKSPDLPAAIWVAAAAGDIIDVATAHGSFRSFTSLLEQLGMTEDLRGYGRFTVFAPTDDAFRAVPQSVLETLLNNRELMAKVLAYHVVSGGTPLSARELRSVSSLTTLERSSIELERRSGKLYVNEARIVEADIEASNGVIHAIDQVLIPPDVMDEISALPHK